MTETTAYDFLLPLAARGMVLDLEAMASALRVYGNPHLGIPCAHIAGTNGKGSTSAMLHSVLRAAGISSALYTSPHLHRFSERFVVNDTEAEPSLAASYAQEIIEDIALGGIGPLTFFEATTLLGWRLFARAGVSLAVLEVGLGGRLDATTLCAPRVTAITRIALDHQAILGSTLRQIAREKAGILKSGVPCILGPELSEGEAREAIEAEARRVGARVLEAPRVRVLELDASGRAELGFEWLGREERGLLGLAGGHQAGNAAVAIGLCQELARGGYSIDINSVKTGLLRVRWPARMERIGRVLIDGAHNLDGIRALCDALPSVCAESPLSAVVFGASEDKPWAEMLSELSARTGLSSDQRFFGAARVARAVDPRVMAKVSGGRACESPAEALARACEAGEGTVLVCGSLYFVARVRAALLELDEDLPVAM